MSVQAPPRIMTTEELFALPDDGVDRWLIRGELCEDGMTKRNRTHASVEARIVILLGLWVLGQPKPRGTVVSGEGGFRLGRNPDSTVGIDVAFASHEQMNRPSESSPWFEGPPILAIEVLSPSDQHRHLADKLSAYQKAETPFLWYVDPDHECVTVHRPNVRPVILSGDDALTCEPQMPGFRIQVKDIFDLE